VPSIFTKDVGGGVGEGAGEDDEDDEPHADVISALSTEMTKAWLARLQTRMTDRKRSSARSPEAHAIEFRYAGNVSDAPARGRSTVTGGGGGDDFNTVAESVAPRLFRVAMRMCGKPEDAEDLVQETLLQGFRKWDQFEGRANPSTWLYTIAARLCQRRHRRRSGEPARLESISHLLPSESDPVLGLHDAHDSPMDEHLRREAERVVGAALARIPPQFRLALVLSDIAELSTPEIARVLGLKEATVKTRIHRGRLAIRRALIDGLPTHQAPPASHDRQICLDLLQAKQEALDRHVEFPFSRQELCSRCQSLFATLDLGREACVGLGTSQMPASVRALLERHRQEQPRQPGSRPARAKA
jgi:RNA polymerase sigma-70 factor, ECF subfamily